MDAEGFARLAGGGVLGTYGLRLLWSWFTREKQESSLYKNEVAAHELTKKELEEERKLRKGAEMDLRNARQEHDRDRQAWFDERQADREARDLLLEEVSKLRGEVRDLKIVLKDKGIHG